MSALPIFDSFATWIRDSWASANQTYILHSVQSLYSRMALQKPERFTAWKRNSREVCNRHAYNSALSIFERFADWKRDSWASADQHSCGSELPIHKCFAAWIRDSCAWANLRLGLWHSSKLNISQPENAIPKKELTAPYLTTLPIFERFGN